MRIPFVDLATQLGPLRAEILRGFEGVFDRTDFILGEEVTRFEKAFARSCGAGEAVGVGSGLDALHLALRALGIGPGDEVIVPAHTFIASALGITFAGAKPIPVDVDERTFCMDPGRIERAITNRTKAILPVHLYGRMMDLSPVLAIAGKRGLPVVEDAAQAHGAEHSGRRAGSTGVLGCFSFYPGKNLGAFGDAGAVVTSDAGLADRLRALRNYGSVEKYHHPIVGLNSRLDTLQAVVLNAKLPHLASYNRARARWAAKYSEALEGVGDLRLPEIPSDGSHVFHLYVVRSAKRDALLRHLQESGIAAGVHYPTPIHLHGAYASLGYGRGSFPVAEKICGEALSLPIFPELGEAGVERVSDAVRGFFG